MSVEKFRPTFKEGQIRHEVKPYTQVLNKVLEHCDNLEALGLWVHFQSKSENWVISVKYIQNHFNVGRDKAYRLLKYLIDTNLMEQVQNKNPDGTFGSIFYIIKNGEQFTKIKDCPKLSTKPLPENPYTEKPYPVNQEHTNKRVLPIKEKARKREALSENFEFTEKNRQLAYATEMKFGLGVGHMLAIFKAWVLKNNIRSYDWQAEFESFCLKEKGNGNKIISNIDPAPRSAVNRMPEHVSERNIAPRNIMGF